MEGLIKNKNGNAIVSISDNVTKCIVNKVDFINAEVIVEYGFTKGSITKQLLRRMRRDAVLFVFETNDKFINELSNINDKRLVIINADADKAKMILKNRYKIEKVDFIISTIPFTIADRRKRKRIIARSFNLLKEKGKFISTQHPWLIYNMIKEQSSAISIKPTFMNMPPVFILEGVK